MLGFWEISNLASNYSDNNYCKKKEKLDWTRAERKRFVEGSYKG